MRNFSEIVSFIRDLYKTPSDFIPLHEPRFVGNEKIYVNECLDSTFVSSVGKFVNQFEEMIIDYTGSKYAVACVNGTSALHISLLLSGVERGDEVITQPLTFIATANAISYTGAKPIFIDVDKETMGMSPTSLLLFLEENAELKNGICINKFSGKRIKACVAMHTFGNPCKIDEIKDICESYNISLVEDAAESLGSLYKGQHTGTFGRFGTLSFNGNKTITTGGGGMILTNDQNLAEKAKHITTTAKIPHKWEFVHDSIAYNYRLTNIAAALGCAQMEQLSLFIEKKRFVSEKYKKFFAKNGIDFLRETNNSRSNYWLNAIILNDLDERNKFLKYMNKNGVMCRPIWKLMNKLDMFKGCQCGDLTNSVWFEERVVNIPSSVLL